MAVFETGDFLIPEEDRRRFVTLDYHLDTYVGILGNGIISGWDIEAESGLSILVTPGSGFIAGLYAESPYATDAATREPLRRSVAAGLGYLIAGEMPGWSGRSGSWTGSFFKEGGSPDEDALVFQQLGPDGEDKDYDGIIDGVLAPQYAEPPASHFEDPYVKAYSPSSRRITLDNNSDTYVFAERLSTDPSLTFVRFVATTSYALTSNRVLIAKVVTRGSEVKRVDTSMTFRLSGMTGKIADIGRELVRTHVHGGSADTDPPRISLKTNIRRCVPSNKVNGVVTYTIVPSKTTGATAGHSHEFHADAAGTGYTTSVKGDYEFHYHRIEGWETSETRGNYGSMTVTEHSHSVPQENSVLSQAGRFKVYVNGVEADPSGYTINASSRTVSFSPGKASITYPVYRCSFQIRGKTANGPKRTYEFEMETPSVKRFIIGMMLNFYRQYSDEIEGVGTTTRTTTVQVWDPDEQDYEDVEVEETALEEGGYYLRSPFDFYFLADDRNAEMDEQGNLRIQDYVPIDEPLTGSIVSGEREATGRSAAVPGAREYILTAVDAGTRGVEDVDPMAIMASTVLKKTGDRFVLLPNVAKFVEMELKRQGRADEVVVEILDDVEVSGVLKQDNIYFVRADKFASGDFSPARIPFLNHVGRIGEALRPQRSGTTTSDGVEFVPSPYRTRVSMGHAHRAYVDRDGNGVTIATIVNDKPAVWRHNADGKAVRITHAHAIAGDKTDMEVSEGVNSWAGAETGTSHQHDVDEVVRGTARCVYSLATDADGNVLVGASDGAFVIPSGRALLTTVGDRQYHSYGLDVVDTLSAAAARYSNETGEGLVLGDAILSQADAAEAELESDGDSYSFGGTPAVSMSVEECAEVDNLYEESIKPEDDIEADETRIRNVSKKTVAETIGIAAGSVEEPDELYLVRRDLSNRGMWGAACDGATFSVVSHGGIAVGKPSRSWKDAVIPVGAGVVRAVAISWGDGGSSSSSGDGTPVMVAAASGGCLASRDGGFSYSAMPGLSGKDCFDVVAAGDGFVVSAGDGAYVVGRDGSFSKTLAAANRRWLAVDLGDDVATVYCVGLDGSISSSQDGGSTWSDAGTMPDGMGETGRLFPAFGRLLAATAGGLIDVSDGSVASAGRFHCMGWSQDGRTAYVGGEGIVLSTTDGTSLSTLASFAGIPFPTFYVDGAVRRFGYAHNYDGGVSFVSPPATTSKVTAATSFDRWIADGGAWDQGAATEIFIDGVRVLSSKTGEDSRGSSCDNFAVDALGGAIDFSTTTALAAKAMRGDSTLYLSDPLSFASRRSVVLSDDDGKTYVAATSAAGVATLASPLPRDVAVGAKVRVLSSMTSDSEVSGSFYESDLDGVGTMTHQEVEDALSDASVGLPMRIGETYIGNLSALALAAKRAIDDVDSGMRNWKAYRLDYGCDPEADDYYGNDFDVEATTAGSKSLFGKESGQATASVVRCIAFGDGEFSSLVFAGADAGLFYTQASDGMEKPWIHAEACPVSDVFGIVVIGGKSLLVAGDGGVCRSEDGDLGEWTLAASLPEANDKATMLGFRWAGSAGTHWWNSWDGSTNTMSADVTNAIVVGGAGIAMVSQDNGQTWEAVDMAAAGDGYEPACLAPISDGTALMAANGGATGKTTMLSDFGVGSAWSEVATFPGISATVASCVADAAGNVALTLSYAGDAPSLKDHSMAGLVATVGSTRRTVADNRDGIVFLQGTAGVAIGTAVQIAPLAVNAIAETDGGQVLAGTSLGMLTDGGTYLSTNKNRGTINRLDKSATVEAIDVGGSVVAAGEQAGESTSLVCTIDRAVRRDDLKRKRLVFTLSTSPSVAILSPSPGTTVYSSEVTVVTSTSMFEPGKSGTIRVTLDAREPVYSSSNSVVLSGVPAGSHVLDVALISTAGAEHDNPEASKRTSFYTSASSSEPSISVTFPSPGQTVGSPSLDVAGQVLNFNATGVDGSLAYALDGGVDTGVVMRRDGWFSIPLSNLANGSHSVRLSLVGATSGQVVTYVDVPFSVDLTSDPYIRITSPSNGSTLAVNHAEVTYSISNFSVPAQGMVRVTVDGTSQSTSTSPTSVALTNLSDGQHTIALTLVDLTLVPVATSYGSATVTVTVQASTASSPRVVILSPNYGTAFPSGTTFVDVSYDTANYVIPDDGGVVIGHGSSETFVTDPSTYRVPVSDGRHSVVLTLATSATAKLSNPEATATISFWVGSPSARASAPSATGSPSTYVAPSQPSQRSPASATATPRATDDASSSSSEQDAGFTVLSNGPSALNGDVVIVVGARMGSEANGLPFRVVGDSSTVYFAPDLPIAPGEFAGGILYIDPSERNNGGKSYGIATNTSSYAVLTSALNPRRAEGDASPPDLCVGQVVRLAGASGGDAWVTFDRDWERNALAGEIVSVDHSNGGRSYGIILSNTSRTMSVHGIDRTQFSPGDAMTILTPVFSDVPSFSAVRTTLDLDHYHATSLVQGWLKGGIESATLLSSSKVMIVASNPSGLDDPLVAADPEVARGAKVVFYGADGDLAFEETIDLVYPTGIVVDVSDPSHWNLDGSRDFGIDASYGWECDARRCGKTVGTTYAGFVAYATRVDRDVHVGDTAVWVPDASKFLPGDAVEIYDSTGTVQETSVVLVGSSVRIADPAEKTFAVEQGASVRARRSSHPTSHEHVVRNGEVYSTVVEEYQDVGYPPEHNHVLSSLIGGVTCVKSNGNGSLYAGGSSESVLVSADEGATWTEATPLSAGEGDGCQSASCMAVAQGGLMAVGTGCGYVVLQSTVIDRSPLPLSVEVVEASSSSSSLSTTSLSSTSSFSSSSRSSSSSSSSSQSSPSSSSASSKSSSSSSHSSSSVVPHGIGDAEIGRTLIVS
jgi:hypothetical protein